MLRDPLRAKTQNREPPPEHLYCSAAFKALHCVPAGFKLTSNDCLLHLLLVDLAQSSNALGFFLGARYQRLNDAPPVSSSGFPHPCPSL